MKKFTKNSSYKIIRITDDASTQLTFDTYYKFEKRNFDIINISNDDELIDIILNNDEVDAIVIQLTNPEEVQLKNVESLPDYYKRRCINVPPKENYGISVALAINTNILSLNMTPLFSIVTPLYKTNLEYFKRAYNSLCIQTLNDWEWILVDDSPEPLNEIKSFIDSQKDIRIKYYRIGPTNGNIGLSKWRGNCLSTGKWLIEFDHDDMLLFWTLQTIAEAIVAYPKNKFIYSDNTTIDEEDKVTGCRYGTNFGLGYGHSYMSNTPVGTQIRTDSSGPVNNATIRHIVGVPNHFRCWERLFYFALGGHNQFMRIADDYELLVRSFLHTRFTHIPVCCYAQRFDGKNSQYDNSDNDTDGQGNLNDIQRRVRLTAIFYDEMIHKRLEDLGLPDDKWIKDDPYETARVYEKIHPTDTGEDVFIPEWAKKENNTETEN